MRKRTIGGLFGLALLLGTLSVGMSVGAASGAPAAAQACMNGGFARYVDDDGTRFPNPQTCVAWVAGHPGESPLIDMAKLCSHGAHILYADDDGNQFSDKDSCLNWVAGHPGVPPVAVDDENTGTQSGDDGQTDQPPIATDESDDDA